MESPYPAQRWRSDVALPAQRKFNAESHLLIFLLQDLLGNRHGAPLARGAAGAIQERDRGRRAKALSWCDDRGAQDRWLVSGEVNGDRGANRKQAQMRPNRTGRGEKLLLLKVESSQFDQRT